MLKTSGENGKYDAAYTYGLERIGVEDIDETRPESQDPLYYLYDGLGSVTYMVKPDGNTRDHYVFDEYGKPAPGNTKQSEDGRINLNNTFGYTGEQWDEETNLLYLRARYYEPETGRFLSRDSNVGEVENPLSRNLYDYVQNNPLGYTDPTGNTKIVTRHNNKRLEFQGIRKNGSIIANLSDLVNGLGGEITYSSSTKSVKASLNSVSLTLYLNKLDKRFTLEGGKVKVDIKTFLNVFKLSQDTYTYFASDDTANIILPESKYNKVARNKTFGSFYYRDIPGTQGNIEIDPDWVAENIVTYTLPKNIQKAWGMKTLRINKHAYTQFNKLFSKFESSPDLLKLASSTAGTFVPRHIQHNFNKGISNHSWGTAIDINAGSHPMGKSIDPNKNPNDPNLILWKNVFSTAGFSWGNSYADPMHYEIL